MSRKDKRSRAVEPGPSREVVVERLKSVGAAHVLRGGGLGVNLSKAIGAGISRADLGSLGFTDGELDKAEKKLESDRLKAEEFKPSVGLKQRGFKPSVPSVRPPRLPTSAPPRQSPRSLLESIAGERSWADVVDEDVRDGSFSLRDPLRRSEPLRSNPFRRRSRRGM